MKDELVKVRIDGNYTGTIGLYRFKDGIGEVPLSMALFSNWTIVKDIEKKLKTYSTDEFIDIGKVKTEPSLESMNMNELKSLAKDMGIKKAYRSKKDYITEIIKIRKRGETK